MVFIMRESGGAVNDKGVGAVASEQDCCAVDTVRFYLSAYDNREHTQGAFHDILKGLDKAEIILLSAWSLDIDSDFAMPDKKSFWQRLEQASQRQNVKIFILVWMNWCGHYAPLSKRIEKKITESATLDKKNIHVLVAKTASDLKNGWLNAHHQKAVCSDWDTYFGGLDFTMGRVDDSTHSGYYNAQAPLLAGWHDVTCVIKSKSAALGFRKMFFDLWNEYKNYGSLSTNHPNETEDIASVLNQKEEKIVHEGGITARLLTTIPISGTHHSLFPQQRAHRGIHGQYVASISEAKDFIFIVNQFLIGDEEHPEWNQIPTKLVEKIIT